jgi:hypothetical protein
MNVTALKQRSDPPRSAVDLRAFATDVAPPETTRGRQGVWLERFEELIDQVPGLWVNATKAWGTKKTAAVTIRRNAEKAELAVEVRVADGELWLRAR